MNIPKSNCKTTIAIVTSCSEAWGGSEELWARSIPILHEKGYKTIVLKYNLEAQHPKFLDLKKNGTTLIDLAPAKSRIIRILKRNWEKLKAEFNKDFVKKDIFTEKIKQVEPSLVVISQGINFDGLGFGCVCKKLGIPYVIVCQKAVDFFWPSPTDRGFMTESLQGAARCFFVSEHNKRLTQQQFGTDLKNAEVIFNPIKLERAILPFPSTEDGFKLACIARLFLLDKGQDILLRILAKPIWQNRKISVSFWGNGVDMDGLVAMAKYLHLSNVYFKGTTDNILDIWKEYHAFILPSRSEGMPLALMEAMSVGRTAIVTNAGGNAELIEEGVNGFLSHISEESFEEAMERAWQRKEEWEFLGKVASKDIQDKVPHSPQTVFVNKIIAVINE